MNKNRLDIVMPLDQKDIIQTHAKFILGDKFITTSSTKCGHMEFDISLRRKESWRKV